MSKVKRKELECEGFDESDAAEWARSVMEFLARRHEDEVASVVTTFERLASEGMLDEQFLDLQFKNMLVENA